MNKYKAVIFDLDGTLLDTTNGVIESVRYTINQLKINELEYKILTSFVGPPIQNSFASHYNMSKEDAQYAANIFRARYKDHDLFKADVYTGVHELLTYLKKKNIKIAIATYKRQDYAIDIIKHFKIDSFCDYIYGADNENKLTKENIITLCIEKLNFNKNEIIMIGDSEHDAIGAQQAGIGFIGVTYGFGFKSPDDIEKFNNIGHAHSTNQIINFIL